MPGAATSPGAIGHLKGTTDLRGRFVGRRRDGEDGRCKSLLRVAGCGFLVPRCTPISWKLSKSIVVVDLVRNCTCIRDA